MSEEIKQINLKLDKIIKALENSGIMTNTKKPIITDLIDDPGEYGNKNIQADNITDKNNHDGENSKLDKSEVLKPFITAVIGHILENPDNNKAIAALNSKLDKIDRMHEIFEEIQKEINGMAYDIRSIRSRIRRDFA